MEEEVDFGHSPALVEASGDGPASVAAGADMQTVIHVPADGQDEHHAPGLLDPSLPMFLWTVGTFAVMAYVLARFAWKPILAGLDAREKDLRDAVENADLIKDELATLDQKRTQIIGGADDQAKEILARARRAGVEAERGIEAKAREEAAILMENARREIRAAQDKAADALRRDSVETAIALAAKLIGEQLEDEKNRQLTDRLIREI